MLKKSKKEQEVTKNEKENKNFKYKFKFNLLKYIHANEDTLQCSQNYCNRHVNVYCQRYTIHNCPWWLRNLAQINYRVKKASSCEYSKAEYTSGIYGIDTNVK